MLSIDSSNAQSNTHLHDILLSEHNYINKLKPLLNFISFLEHSPRLPSQNFFMLIRPRGFGLSLATESIESILIRDELLIDHIEHISQNELSHYNLGDYPVLHFSFTQSKLDNIETFTACLAESIQKQIWEHHVKIKTESSPDLRLQLLQLIQQLAAKEAKPVVILIDNYDAPIAMVRHITALEEQQQALALYYELLNVFRQAGTLVKFCLLTGHAKFALSNDISEGLPHVIDLSFSDITADLLGFTRKEIETYFADDLKRLAPQQGVTVEEYLQILEDCYGGFVFSDKMQKVLCPRSVARAFENDGALFAYSCEYNYAFLQDVLGQNNTDVDWLIDKDGQDQLLLEEIDLNPKGKQLGSLLLQQGLATVNKVTFSVQEHSLSWRYRFGIPNVEMRRVFNILTRKARPSLRELPINSRVYDAGEEEYLIPPKEE